MGGFASGGDRERLEGSRDVRLLVGSHACEDIRHRRASFTQDVVDEGLRLAR